MLKCCEIPSPATVRSSCISTHALDDLLFFWQVFFLAFKAKAKTTARESF
jgi:hypothetical protein